MTTKKQSSKIKANGYAPSVFNIQSFTNYVREKGFSGKLVIYDEIRAAVAYKVFDIDLLVTRIHSEIEYLGNKGYLNEDITVTLKFGIQYSRPCVITTISHEFGSKTLEATQLDTVTSYSEEKMVNRSRVDFLIELERIKNAEQMKK